VRGIAPFTKRTVLVAKFSQSAPVNGRCHPATANGWNILCPLASIWHTPVSSDPLYQEAHAVGQLRRVCRSSSLGDPMDTQQAAADMAWVKRDQWLRQFDEELRMLRVRPADDFVLTIAYAFHGDECPRATAHKYHQQQV
jgi:hypothetical protein